jgi:hypothetical protein
MLRRLLLVLVAALSCALPSMAPVGAASTTMAEAVLVVYDAPVTSNSAVYGRGGLSDAPRSPGLQEGSASPSAGASDASTTPFARSNATEAVPGIKTPYGVAEQGTDAGSIALRGQVESGGTVYRQGVTGTQQTAEGQFWAGQNPASTPGYANSYGTPGTQVAEGEYPWIMGGTVEPGTPFVTRGAPGIGTNLGGAPEVVVNPGGVRNLWFHMPD